MTNVDLSPLAGHRPDDESLSPRKFALRVFFFTTLWWTSSVLNVIVIKDTTGHTGIFPHGFAFTALVQPTMGLCAWILAKTLYRKPQQQPPPLTSREWAKVILMGMIQGCEIGLTNKALEFLTVAQRTELNSLSVLFIMVSARVWSLERLGWRRLLSMALCVVGGLLQTPGHGGDDKDQNLQVVGMIMQLTSMALSSQRWCLAQVILSHQPPESALGKMRKFQLLAKAMPITGLVCLPLALAFEPTAWTADELFQPALLTRVLIVAGGLTAMLYAELQMVKMLSAVAFNVLSTVHQIPVVIAGVILNHDRVSSETAFGFGLCIVGTFVYGWARLAERKT